jgi:hypothetical protein
MMGPMRFPPTGGGRGVALVEAFAGTSGVADGRSGGDQLGCQTCPPPTSSPSLGAGGLQGGTAAVGLSVGQLVPVDLSLPMGLPLCLLRFRLAAVPATRGERLTPTLWGHHTVSQAIE